MKTLFLTVITAMLLTSTSFAGDTSTTPFPPLTGGLKAQADQVAKVDYTVTKQAVTSDNAKTVVNNIIKAIDVKDTRFFQEIKDNETFDMSGLNCVVEVVNEMPPADKTMFKGALKQVVPLLGYNASMVDLFIS